MTMVIYIPPLTGQSLGTPPTLTVTALTPNPAGGSLKNSEVIRSPSWRMAVRPTELLGPIDPCLQVGRLIPDRVGFADFALRNAVKPNLDRAFDAEDDVEDDLEITPLGYEEIEVDDFLVAAANPKALLTFDPDQEAAERRRSFARVMELEGDRPVVPVDLLQVDEIADVGLIALEEFTIGDNL